MDNIDKEELLKRYREGKVSEAELRQLESWYADWNMKERVVLSEDNLNRAEELMRDNVMGRIGGKRIKLWPRIAAVAAAVASIVLGVYFFNHRSDRHPDSETSSAQAAANDIAPGKNGATITLGNGKVIQLSDAKTGVVIGNDKLAYNDGEILRDALDDKNNNDKKEDDKGRGGLGGKSSAVAKTAKGQTYIFTLPDGSKVWLNAASTLTIPSDFSGTESRKVELTGEAYFEIAKVTRLSATGKDSGRERVPFVVKSADQEIEVFGTHFNVNSYEDESITRTTLLEGSVRVTHLSAMGREKSVLLKPGQESALSRKGELKVLTADTELVLAWKNNKFMFENEDIRTIMRMVERWYNVDVVFDGEIPEDKFLGSVSRFDHISKVLKTLELTEKVHFKLEGRRLIVTK